MPGWITKIYTIYTVVLFLILLSIALLFYVPVRLFAPYLQQMRWVYAINRCVMMIWAPLAGFRFKTSDDLEIDRKGTYIVVMNHQNLLDMLAAAKCLKAAGKPLIKKELLKIPILGWVFAMAALPVKRQSAESRKASYKAMVEEVKKGISILIFPEGTRNRSANPLIDFKPGAFKLAVETGTPILPVVVMNTRKKSHPDAVILKPGLVIIRHLNPVDPADFTGNDDPVSSMKDHCHKIMEQEILKYDPYFKTIAPS